MSQKVLDELLMRAVSDGAFRAKLLDRDRFAEAIDGCDLTPEEVDRLKRVALERSAAAFPFAQGLNERLAK